MQTVPAMRSLFRFVPAAACAALLCGCASSYRFGTTLDPELRDVYVPTVLNESSEPGVARAVDQALRREIRREGTLRMVPESEAATRLDVVVTDYSQSAVSYSQHDTQHPNEYKMTISARVSFVKLARPQAGRPAETAVWQRGSVTGSENFAGGADSLSAKSACLPEASKDLAVAIVDGCVGAW